MVQYSTVQYITVHYSTVQFRTELNSKEQYKTASTWPDTKPLEMYMIILQYNTASKWPDKPLDFIYIL